MISRMPSWGAWRGCLGLIVALAVVATGVPTYAQSGPPVGIPLSGPAPKPIPTFTSCPECRRIPGLIEALDAKIGALERSNASLRKYGNLNDPGIQAALREDEAKLAQFRQQRDFLADCLKKCGYKEPGKEEKEKGSYTRAEYEKHIESPGHTLTPTERDLIDLGCVGLCRVRQALPGMQEYPDKAPGVQCYLTLKEALSKKCDEGWRLFVFAKQGKWKNGTPATQSPVPPDNVVGPYNYATYFPDDGGTWEYMNCNVTDAGGRPGQEVYIRGQLPNKEATIYCSHCVKGWSHPGKGDPKDFSKAAK
jgi:hypothetical protein